MSERGACLITGATGFIGGHIARRLATQDHRVRCLVREGSDTSALEDLDVELVQGELTDRGSLREAVKGCCRVVHCGALVSDWATVQEIASVNVEGTRGLLDAALAAGVQRFLHISTTDVYGHPGGAPIGEDFLAGGLGNWYSRTKLMAEREVRRSAAAKAMETAIIRPATVYGPRSTAVIGEIAQALRNGNMLLIGAGKTVAGLCYVENLVDLVALALGEDAAAGETFNASDEIEVTWRRLTDDLAIGLGVRPARLSMPYPLAYGLGLGLEQGYRLARRATGLKTRPLLSRQAVQVMGRDQRFSSQKAKALLGWEPRIGYADGLRATLDWCRHSSARTDRLDTSRT